MKSKPDVPPLESVPLVGRREKRKREVHARIYHTATRLFLDQGFTETPVSQIAKEASVAEATFFNHFPSKAAVLQEMAEQVSNVVGILVEKHGKDAASFEQLLLDALEDALLLAAELGELARDVLLELMRTGAAPGEAGPLLDQIGAHLIPMIEAGQTRGDVRNDRDAGFLAEMLTGVLQGIVTRWVNDAAYPIDARARAGVQFLAEAFAPRDPRTLR